jgi:hypothetical protein
MMASLFRKAPCRSRRTWARLQVEALEARELLSTAPLVYSVVHSTGHSLAGAQAVGLLPMLESQAQITENGNGVQDFYKVQLRRGDIFTASDHATYHPSPSSTAEAHAALDLLDAHGNRLAHADNLKESPARTDPALLYNVPSDGTYYVKVTTSQAASVSYDLHLRPIGLNNGLTDPRWLNPKDAQGRPVTGPLDVWLSGGVLELAGPSGRGFGIAGNWTHTVSGAGATAASTYRATGTITLETALGGLPITLPRGVTFTVTTQAGLWGQSFGELNQISGSVASAADLINNFTSKLPLGDLHLSVVLPQITMGVKLGSELAGNSAFRFVPLDAAVPYVYFQVSMGASVTVVYGNIRVSASLPSPSINLVAAADPSDPSLFVSINNLPAPVQNFTLAYSREGLIPFTPKATPAYFHGTITGNAYLNISGISLSDAGVPLPLFVSGDLTINVDPNHTGKFLGGAFNNLADLVTLIHSDPKSLGNSVLQRLHTAFDNMAIGQNGTLTLGADLNQLLGIDKNYVNLKASLPIGNETFIWDGPHETASLTGAVPNPFQGTPLQNFLGTQESVDAYVSLRDHQFDFRLAGSFHENLPLGVGSVQGQAHFEVSALLDHGALRSNVALALAGSVEAFGVVRGSLDAALTIRLAGGHLTYSGGGTAEVDLLVLGHWVHVGRVNVGVSHEELSLTASVLGLSETVTVPLPV